MVLRHLLQSGSIFGVLLFATLRPICLPIPRLIGVAQYYLSKRPYVGPFGLVRVRAVASVSFH